MDIDVFVLCCITDLHNAGFKYLMYLCECIYIMFYIVKHSTSWLTSICSQTAKSTLVRGTN